MKKCIVILLVAATMILCLTGCFGKTATAVVTFDNFTSGTVVPALGSQPMTPVGLQDNVMTVRVPQEGTYVFRIAANDTVYNFTLTYVNGQFTGEADQGLTFSIK